MLTEDELSSVSSEIDSGKRPDTQSTFRHSSSAILCLDSLEEASDGLEEMAKLAEGGQKEMGYSTVSDSSARLDLLEEAAFHGGAAQRLVMPCSSPRLQLARELTHSLLRASDRMHRVVAVDDRAEATTTVDDNEVSMFTLLAQDHIAD
jgi:hypothetical protein